MMKQCEAELQQHFSVSGNAVRDQVHYLGFRVCCHA